MAGLCGPRGHVLAFEPNPRMGHRLQATMMVNGLQDRVTFHQEVLGATDGDEVNLVIWNNHPGGSQVTLLEPEGHQLLKAKTRRLDGFPRALDATLIKIDVEGSEEMVWRGMTRMIQGSKLRYIIVEFTPSSYHDAQAMLGCRLHYRLHRRRYGREAHWPIRNPRRHCTADVAVPKVKAFDPSGPFACDYGTSGA
ncbi:MAG: FkbM family methyltransferase, partial [Rhizorhabdus sp.]